MSDKKNDAAQRLEEFQQAVKDGNVSIPHKDEVPIFEMTDGDATLTLTQPPGEEILFLTMSDGGGFTGLMTNKDELLKLSNAIIALM